jgi:hypothetical protein
VRVPAKAGWRQNFTGTITDRAPRPVTTTAGQDLFYWVQFDKGQYDVDGDGPYADGEILASYLETISQVRWKSSFVWIVAAFFAFASLPAPSSSQLVLQCAKGNSRQGPLSRLSVPAV